MGIKIQSTLDVKVNGAKCLVYARAGVGKTKLCATAPDPIVLSAEAGLLSLQDEDIPYIEIDCMETLNEAYRHLTESKEAEEYRTICLDSITEIAEVMLIGYKKEEKDPRQAYGRLNDDIASTIRAFRDLPGKNVYFTAKLQRVEDDFTGITRNMPGMPGKTTLNATSFYFDGVYAMRIGQLEDGTSYRYLQTQPTIDYEAKDRSGKLKIQTEPNLTEVFKQIAGGE